MTGKRWRLSRRTPKIPVCPRV
ncbi:hypothetical protein AB0E75_07485 [Streptomyces griseoviridis]